MASKRNYIAQQTCEYVFKVCLEIECVVNTMNFLNACDAWLTQNVLFSDYEDFFKKYEKDKEEYLEEFGHGVISILIIQKYFDKTKPVSFASKMEKAYKHLTVQQDYLDGRVQLVLDFIKEFPEETIESFHESLEVLGMFEQGHYCVSYRRESFQEFGIIQ